MAGAESFRASVLIAEPADAGTCCAALLMLKAGTATGASVVVRFKLEQSVIRR